MHDGATMTFDVLLGVRKPDQGLIQVEWTYCGLLCVLQFTSSAAHNLALKTWQQVRRGAGVKTNSACPPWKLGVEDNTTAGVCC